MKEYKVYAKILGYVLPDENLEIGDCKIEKMSYREQRERNFQHLKGRKLREFNMNYMTFPRGADFRILRSNFVVSTLLESSSPNGAIGLAEMRFDKLIGVLMLYMHNWWLNKHPERKIRFSNYDYQICKLYEIVDTKEIEIKDLRPISASASMCHYPAFKELTDDFRKIIEYYINCQDEIFEKSLKYFTNGIKGLYSQLPEEKVFLDLFKSIELIINNFQRKRTNKLRTKLNYAAKRLNLNKIDRDKISLFWDTRSRGDIAHARKRKNYLPPQYPIPSDCELFINYSDLIDLSQKVIINYFNYIKGRYEILINPSEYKDLGLENGLTQVLTSWDSNFVFTTKERNKRRITPLIKKEMAKKYKINVHEIRVLESRKDKLILKLE